MSHTTVQSKPMRALIMAGGTGGHVYPALAVAHELRDRGWDIDWVGTERGLEARVVPANDFVLHTLSVLGLRGKGLMFRVRSVLHLIGSLLSAILLVAKLKPSVVLGMGGYASGPAGLAAWLLRRPLVIHEQNAVAGTTNRWLKPVATRVLCGLPGAFPVEKSVSVVGNPVRKDITSHYFDLRETPEEFSVTRPLRLLVVGGSLGSKPLNEGVPAGLRALSRDECSRVAVKHQCGTQHLDAARESYGEAQLASVEVMPFIEDMGAAYAWADLVIARAGALTVTELAMTGTPSILVPLPHAIDDHQTMNARTLSSHGAAQLLPQQELSPHRLGKMIRGYLEFPGRLQAMSDKAHALANPTATDTVVDVLTEVARAA